MTEKFTRRRFMASGLAAATGIAIGGPAILKASSGAKLNIAAVGIGGMGNYNLQNMKTENIVALCDVDDQYAAKTFEQFTQAKKYRDFRIMLEKQKDIDAVLIATPDHTHAPIAAAAMRAGKHVFCQKPLTHTAAEARKLAEIAAKIGVVTQMGNQGHSTADMRRLVEMIRDGAIGTVREVEAWCTLSYYPWGHEWWSSTLGRKPERGMPVPEALDWDLWLGPAAERPYHSCYHPAKWRAWWDFGSGMMGDRGVHTLDAPFWALKLGHPESIHASVTDFNADTHPLAAVVTFQFPARDEMPPVKLVWYEGLQPPRPDDLEDGRELPNEGGVIFKGEKGTLIAGIYAESPQLIPYQRMKEYTMPAESIPRISVSHEQNWIESIRKGQPATSDFGYSSRLTELTILGNIAKRMQTQLLWDGEAMKFTNNEEANRYLTKPYRKGWELE